MNNNSFVRIIGVVCSFFILAVTASLIHTAYRMWQNTPVFLTQQGTQLELDLAFFFAGVIILTVGVYLSRNVYRWSTRA